MAVTGVMRPGYVQMRVLDLDEATLHYRDRIGLELVGRSGDRAFFRGFDEFDRHSIILREADMPGLDRIGFKVCSEKDLDHFAERLAAGGVATDWIGAGEDPGVGRKLRFAVPTGHIFDLYAEMELSADGPPVKNPDVWRSEPRGMRAMRYDHSALNGIDVAGSARIFVDALDFSVTEELVDEESGARLGIFLSCSNKAHDIAFLAGPEDAKIHHTSFRLESWNDVGNAADIISRYDISLDIGPTRHGITRGQTIYFFDPSGNRNETFSGGYDYYPDNPRRTWGVDQAGKAIFYYEKALNDRFMTVNT
ncbi:MULTISPECIES: catechol 2,3-dioxygenase [unclassified Sphingopyxis]|jgi:catechol 2,3-dioxygenase|uniref:catechol 2,3-dioxygenase n=2 Tax=Sphingopyxis TaxID=165697 RepID=UPI000737399B|nr:MULTISPECIES: catechol 2,3-dioxygenase [unclassified Sphingopyxis]KTE40413.1 catechol 2,3-dioxygenase [Sphingopyxis sp. HIX]KTE85091.1 catechol 2,3-dioxygenase [Sphingopyxis sp. HXXIV]